MKSYTQPLKRRCTFKTFWLGFTDWYAERCNPSGVARKDDKPKANRGLQTILLVGLLVGAPAVAALIGPMAAGTMSAVGTSAVAASTQVLSVIIGLGFFIGLPAWAGYRTYKFCRAMCDRGYDILDGRRTRVRLL
jgi:hypothetical protein